jgi:hypothetical protein
MSGPKQLRRWRWRWLVLPALAIVLALVVVATGDRMVSGPSRRSAVIAAAPPGGPADSQERLSQELLHRLSLAIAQGNRAGFLSSWLAAAPTQHRGEALFARLMRLHVGGFSARTDEGTVGGGSTWSAAVDVTWRLEGFDGVPAHSVVLVSFARRKRQSGILSIGSVSSERTPVWLVPSLRVQHRQRITVAGTAIRRMPRVAHLLTDAVRAVSAVLPAWRGNLLAFVPATERQFDLLLDAQPHAYDGIAAVTTTIDGSRDVRVPCAIVVNPGVFAGLGPISAQVVITHEATHAATGAAAVSMPPWVAEGFADYVAIGSSHVPTARAAARALGVVRRAGPPDRLPSPADFDSSGMALEAAYEEAWLANSLIAREDGQRRLVEFYFAIERHRATMPMAFRSILGTTEQAFTRSWTHYLEVLSR